MERKEEISYFKQKLIELIAKKKKINEMSDEFQDVHWDDVYDVYYDSSN